MPIHVTEHTIPTSALILGTLHGQSEIMARLQDRGWYVHSCGHVRQGPGVDQADEFHLADIVDVDEIAGLAERLNVDMVYSVGSDIAMPTIAAVSERLNLPGFHDIATTEILHRKVLLREFLSGKGLSPVASMTVRKAGDLDRFDTWPAIIKPSDSQGQRGIAIVDDRHAAELALDAAIDASLTSTAIIEELLVGPEISVHVFAVDGRVEFSLPSDRIVWDGSMVGVPAAHVVPCATLDETTHRAVDRLITDFVEALEVQTGPLYFQLKLTQAGPRIIEVAPRLDGCHLWRLVELHTGFNIADRCFDLLDGRPWSPIPAWDSTPTLRLEFFLGDPSTPLDRDAWPAVGPHVMYQEFQVDDGALPRSTNPVVARLGFRIVEMSDE